MCDLQSNISENQKTVLVEAFDGGLQSTSKANQQGINDVAAKAGLPVQTVKNFIGNFRRSKKGKKYHRTTVHTKGVSAYNLFCKERAGAGVSDKSLWGAEWTALSSDEKRTFRDRAQTLNLGTAVEESGRKSYINKVMKKIQHHIDQLALQGMEVLLLGVDVKEEAHTVMAGTKKGMDYISQKRLDQMFESFLECSHQQPKVDNRTHADFVKEVQCMMNAKYEIFTNQSKHSFPYNLCKIGDISLGGFPSECLPVKAPSCYGIPKLKLILEASNRIYIQARDSVSTVSTDAEIMPVHVPISPTTTSATTSSAHPIPTEGIPMTIDRVEDDGNVTLTVDSQYLPALNELTLPLKEESNLGAPRRSLKRTSKKLKVEELECVNRTQKRKKDAQVQETYEVEKLVDKRKRGRTTEYRIRWRGFTKDHDTWEPAKNIYDKDLIAKFM